MKKYEYHPLSEIFPLIQDQDFIELSEDLKQNGLISPIILYEDKILDGRNRYRACLESDVEPRFKKFKGDALSFVVSANVHRRHMSVGQRAMVAAKIANMEVGKPSKSNSLNSGNIAISQSEAAEKMSVSVDSVEKAKKLLDEASKKTIEEVESGEKTINGALQELKEKKKGKEILLDKTNWPVPEDLVPLWNRGKEVQAMVSAISKIKGTLKKAQDDEDILYRSINFSGTLTHLENSQRGIKNALPFAVCWVCSGKNFKKCTMCKGTGLVSEFTWESFCPKEIKAIRLKVKK